MTAAGITERLLVLQHIAREPPTAHGDELRAQGGSWCQRRSDAGEPASGLAGFAEIVAMLEHVAG